MLLKLTANDAGITAGLDAIESQLEKYRLEKKEIVKAMLASEEIMSSLIAHASEDGRMQMNIRKLAGDITIEIAVTGKAYDFVDSLQFGVSLDTDDISQDAELTLRNIILRSFAQDLKYKNRHGMNSVQLTVLRSNKTQLYYTLGAMLLAIVLGILMKAVAPAGLNNFLNSNVLTPVKTMFMNGLKMVVAPVVFFSIVSCIGQFTNLSEMGKVGGKTMLMYLLTTIFATAIGIGSVYLFRPGNASLAGSVIADASSITSQQIKVSLLDTVVNIVPSNFVKPFLEADMLQLIFLAVFCGIAVGMIGKYSKILTDFFEACNELFLKITVLLVKFMPVAAFCSILSMILKTGVETLLSVLSMCGVFIFGLCAIMLVYCLMMPLLARLNPLPFLRKYSPTMLQVFSMASSNAALPLNMNACGQKLGISSKVYSLSLPLGATMNMDGTCIYLGVFALALARIYGIEVNSSGLMSVVMSIIILSVGAPGIPGSGLICLSVLLAQLGVPVEAVGLVIGIDPLIGMLRCMSNCLGDVAISTIVARQEKMIDLEVYRKNA